MSQGRALPHEVRLRPATTALVVVDMQNDFCHPEGVFGRTGANLAHVPGAAAVIQSLIEAANRSNVLTIFVRATYDEAVMSEALAETYARRGFAAGQCLEGSWGAEWYGDVRPQGRPNQVVVTKHRFSPFWDTPIDLYLRSNGIATVVVVGVVTSGCVESTVRDAFFNDYFVVVAADGVADPSPARHVASVSKLSEAFGTVIPAGVIITEWDAAVAAAPSWDVSRKRAEIPANMSARVAPSRTALVLIDLQNDFCHPGGAIAARGEDLSLVGDAVAATGRLLDAARRSSVPVIHVRAEYGEVDASPASLSAGSGVGARDCCLPGTWGQQPVEELRPAPGEAVVVKHRFSAFVDTELESLLRVNGIRTIVVAGVATHCCVESTVRDAALKDFSVVVARDCVAARARMKHLHDASLETMELYFAKVVTSSDLIDCWSSGAPMADVRPVPREAGAIGAGLSRVGDIRRP